MSSILKALKKLESETDQEMGGDTWPHKIGAGETLHKQTRRLHRFSGPFLVGFGILGMGIAAALFYFPAPADPPVPPAASGTPGPIAGTPQPAPVPPPRKAQMNPPAPLQTDSKPIAKAVPPPKSGSGFPTPPTPFHRTAQKPDTESNPPSMPPAPPLPRKSGSGPSSALSKPVPTEPQYEVYKEKPSAAGPQPADPTQKTFENPPAALPAQPETSEETAMIAAHASIPEKSSDESGLQIQALVWSSDPDDRMAVINGNIVKQGGKIGEEVLSFIGEDYILIQQEGREWKIRFQLK